MTASLDQVIFKEPIKAGELAAFKANVNYAGRTSMETGIKVIAGSTTQEARRTNLRCFTLAARREGGSPCAAPPHEIKTGIERLFEAGKMRKEIFQEIMERLEPGSSGECRLRGRKGSKLSQRIAKRIT